MLQTTTELYLQDKNQNASQRLAYWRQLGQAELSEGCVSCIGGYLWLSSLAAVPQRHTIFIDPLLAEQMVSGYSNIGLQLDAPTLSGGWDREQIWPEIAPDGHILVMAKPNVGAEDTNSWLLVDLHVTGNTISQVQLLIGPAETVKLDACDQYLEKLVYAVRSVLPRPNLHPQSLEVERQILSIILPQPYSDEAIGHVLLACLCSKLLRLDLTQVNIPAFQQSLLYFYEKTLRPRILELTIPWPGITNDRGRMYGHQMHQQLARRRLSAPPCQPSSHFDAFPRTESYLFTLVKPGVSEKFFTELSQAISSHAETILSETRGRSVDLWEQALFLAPYRSWPQRMRDQKLRTPDAYSLDEFSELLLSLGGPDSVDAQKLLLTGKLREERIKVDWLKDTVLIDKDWCLGSSDVDSLSLTVKEAPVFLEAGSYYPYPSRAQSITSNNSLVVNVGNTKIDMHQSKPEADQPGLN